jgi:hypothetical protein
MQVWLHQGGVAVNTTYDKAPGRPVGETNKQTRLWLASPARQDLAWDPGMPAGLGRRAVE